MLIKVNDEVRKKGKDGEELGYKEEERALIIGKKHKFEKKTASSGRVYGSLTMYEYNTYYHITVFDEQLIELFNAQVDKNDVLVAVCNVQWKLNTFKNVEEPKYTMVECLAPKKMLLTPSMPEPEKHTHENKKGKDDLDFDFDSDDDEIEISGDDLPF